MLKRCAPERQALAGRPRRTRDSPRALGEAWARGAACRFATSPPADDADADNAVAIVKDWLTCGGGGGQGATLPSRRFHRMTAFRPIEASGVAVRNARNTSTPAIRCAVGSGPSK